MITYLKINDIDYSPYTSSLVVDTIHKYTAVENSLGTIAPKYKAKKHNIKVGIIPLDSETLKNLYTAINSFRVTVECIDPETMTLKTFNCIIPSNSIEYYTIRADKTLVKGFNFTCEEL